mgnify:CR=1 FL=1
MKRYLLLFAALCMVTAGHAQKKNFSYKFYGQVRGDLFYNSRANAEIVDGLFHLYPKDKNLDADGNDLNATANGSFYLLYSRLGVDVTGPNIGKAVTTAKLEADFRGSGSNWAVLRIRHAYVNLGKIGGIGRTNLASVVRRCISANVEPFDRCAFPTV